MVANSAKGATGRHLVKYPVAEMQSEEMGNNKKPERNCETESERMQRQVDKSYSKLVDLQYPSPFPLPPSTHFPSITFHFRTFHTFFCGTFSYPSPWLCIICILIRTVRSGETEYQTFSLTSLNWVRADELYQLVFQRVL